MQHFRGLFAVLGLSSALFVGCEQAVQPQQPEREVAVNQVPPAGVPQLPQELADASAARLENIINSQPISIDGTGGSKSSAGVDYDNSHYYYVWYPSIGYHYPVYSNDYDYTDGGTPPEVQFQRIYIEFWQYAGYYDTDYQMVIPMSQDDYNSLNIYAGGGVSYSFVTNDGVTGLTGLKVDVSNLGWYYPPYYGYTWMWGYIHVYRYTRGTANYYPQFEPIYYGIDAGGNASQVGPYFSFVPSADPTWTISGNVYYDVNQNGQKDASEFGIQGVTVTLENVGTTSTDANGDYSFTEVDEGTYDVTCDAIGGFVSTTGLSASVELAGGDGSADFGFALDFDALSGATADGNGMGWWKNNIRKAVQGQNRGVQIDAATLETLRSSLAVFGLDPLNFASLADALAALNYNGGNAASRLAQHLTASEYNYANGAFLDGNQLVTWALVIWGEYLLENAGDFNNGDLNAAKDLFEGYNEGQIG